MLVSVIISYKYFISLAPNQVPLSAIGCTFRDKAMGNNEENTEEGKNENSQENLKKQGSEESQAESRLE